MVAPSWQIGGAAGRAQVPPCSGNRDARVPAAIPSTTASSWALGAIYFFFQAEDGIRDYKVTGVQTCALPILILIPEIPFDMEKVCEKIRHREAEGRHFSIVVVAEGAAPRGGSVSLIDPEHERLGGIGDKGAHSIQEMTRKETRTLVLGHLQRGGSPTTFDRLLGLRFGAAAVRVIADGKFGTMVALRPPTIAPIPIDEALAAPKLVPLDSDTIATARDIGISLGD